MKSFFCSRLLVGLIIIFASCTQNTISRPYSPSYLDSVIRAVEDSIVRVERYRKDSTALSLAQIEIANEKSKIDTIDVPFKENKQVPVVIPQIDKDSFDILK